MSDLMEWLRQSVGKPIPCAICKAPTLAESLREITVPGAYISEWDMTISEIVWVCPGCPG